VITELLYVYDQASSARGHSAHFPGADVINSYSDWSHSAACRVFAISTSPGLKRPVRLKTGYAGGADSTTIRNVGKPVRANQQ